LEFSTVGELRGILRRCLANWARGIETDKRAPRLDPRDNSLHYAGDRFSLNFEDIEVRAILQVIADFTDLNIVCSDSVRGNIRHLRLKNVPWDQALSIVLRSKGLAMTQEGNVILVATPEEISSHQAR
jgi:type II secretory pathway component HofQ